MLLCRADSCAPSGRRFFRRSRAAGLHEPLQLVAFRGAKSLHTLFQSRKKLVPKQTDARPTNCTQPPTQQTDSHRATPRQTAAQPPSARTRPIQKRGHCKSQPFLPSNHQETDSFFQKQPPASTAVQQNKLCHPTANTPCAENWDSSFLPPQQCDFSFNPALTHKHHSKSHSEAGHCVLGDHNLDSTFCSTDTCLFGLDF